MIIVLLVGWRLGGPIGIGTIVCTFGIGIMMQFAFVITRFEPKDVEHTGFLECWNMLRSDEVKKTDN